MSRTESTTLIGQNAIQCVMQSKLNTQRFVLSCSPLTPGIPHFFLLVSFFQYYIITMLSITNCSSQLFLTLSLKN